MEPRHEDIGETYEETGVVLNDVKLWKVMDSPKENRQNIVFRYYAIVPNAIKPNSDTELRGGESNEVLAVTWIPVKMLDRYQWAFNHDKAVQDLMKELNLN